MIGFFIRPNYELAGQTLIKSRGNLTKNQRVLLRSVLNTFKKEAIGKQFQIYGRANRRYIKLRRDQKTPGISDRELIDLAGKGYIAIFSSNPKRVSLKEKALALEPYNLPEVAPWIFNIIKGFIGLVVSSLLGRVILLRLDVFIVETVLPNSTNLLLFYLIPFLIVILFYVFFSRRIKLPPLVVSLLLIGILITSGILPHLTIRR